ncbi:hypothetical protein CGRA01v4_15006 [Colletotrichum graminicola]|nr:hypothetical protein CGRA01v4_15006 [Colletotrichum graminicola]
MAELDWVKRRSLQLHAEDYWSKSFFVAKQEGKGPWWSSGDTGDRNRDRLWCLVTSREVDIESGSALVDRIAAALPPGGKYYRVLEHHTAGTVGKHALLHCCLVALVRFRNPVDVHSFRQKVCYIKQRRQGGTVAVDACPNHISGSDPLFLSVVH